MSAAELATPSGTGTSSSKDTSSSTQGLTPPERCFQQGCAELYLLGGCKSANCQRLHDLSPQEKAHFLEWVRADNNHLVFSSSSGSNSCGSSVGSTGGLGNDEGGNASSSTAGTASIRPALLEEIGADDPNSSYRHLIVRIVEKCKGLTEEELMKQLPRDEDGNHVSLGSILHGTGKCSPCIYKARQEVCKGGLHCRFCHFKHTGRQRPKLRHSKGKRQRYRELMTHLTERLQADPENFDVQDLDLPPSIESNSMLKKKLQDQISDIAERMFLGKEPEPEALQGQLQGEGSGSSGAAANGSGLDMPTEWRPPEAD